MKCSFGHFPVSPIYLRDRRLQSQGSQYPFLRHFVRNESSLLECNSTDHSIHCVGQDNVDTGALEVVGLGVYISIAIVKDGTRRVRLRTFRGDHLITFCASYF